MVNYAIGRFERGQSGSPYQFVCKKVYPQGPYALLDIKRRRISPPDIFAIYLFEIEDWHSIDQRSQYVTRLIATLGEIHFELNEALKSASWEMVEERGRRRIQVVGQVIKTKFGIFRPEYHNGLNAFGPGQDVDPWITFEPCPGSVENPYGDVWGSNVAQSYLSCSDEAEIKRAHDACIAKEDLGDLLRERFKG